MPDRPTLQSLGPRRSVRGPGPLPQARPPCYMTMGALDRHCPPRPVLPSLGTHASPTLPGRYATAVTAVARVLSH
jgi:hypothetical protein